MRETVIILTALVALLAGTNLTGQPSENNVCEGRHLVHFIETFEKGEDVGGWRWGNPWPFLPIGLTYPVPKGGLAGAYLGGQVESFAPTVMTTTAKIVRMKNRRPPPHLMPATSNGTLINKVTKPMGHPHR